MKKYRITFDDHLRIEAEGRLELRENGELWLYDSEGSPWLRFEENEVLEIEQLGRPSAECLYQLASAAHPRAARQNPNSA